MAIEGPIIGVDIGQKHDPTAICVAKPYNVTINEVKEQHFDIHYLERLPLGTRYQQVAERLAFIVDQAAMRTYETPKVFIDATGVGQPVVDLLAGSQRGRIDLTPVYFTHGDRRYDEGDSIKLGKAFLVSRLQVLLQTGRISVPRTPESEALAEELINYEIRISENGQDRYGAFRTGAHDDLVTALGLAVQIDFDIEGRTEFGF